MADAKPPARVAFTAHRDLVQRELDAGWSARAIHRRHKEKFAGISYRQFVRYADELRPTAARPSSAKLTPLTTAKEPRTDGGYDPDGNRFKYTPDPKAPTLWKRVEPTDTD